MNVLKLNSIIKNFAYIPKDFQHFKKLLLTNQAI
jgi:hypothetical protein